MTDQWAVVLDVGDGELVIYGPIDDEGTARKFAQYLTAEVDPATACRLRSPVRELLAWHDTKPGYIPIEQA
jgi:hypothetical protein